MIGATTQRGMLAEMISQRVIIQQKQRTLCVVFRMISIIYKEFEDQETQQHRKP
jgi:hypothetical protein